MTDDERTVQDLVTNVERRLLGECRVWRCNQPATHAVWSPTGARIQICERCHGLIMQFRNVGAVRQCAISEVMNAYQRRR